MTGYYEARHDEEHFWLILNSQTQQAWSNEFGWVPQDSEGYDLFSDEEKASLNLPTGGYWHDPDQ
jgi:hypothetical protein